MKKNKKRSGFTLMELLAVIVILGLLMAIAIPSITKYITQSRKKTVVSTIEYYIGSIINELNDLNYSFNTTNTVYAVPIECIPLEKGGKSPFGEWMQANNEYWGYVLVQYNDDNSLYTYGYTFKDNNGYGLYPTTLDSLNKQGKQIKTGLDLKRPTNGTISNITSPDNWNGFEVDNLTDLVVLVAESEGNVGNGKTTCTLQKKGNNYEQVEEAKKKKYAYYNKLSEALEDVNNGTIGVHADAEKGNANVCVYIDEQGKSNIVILKDITISNTLNITTNTIINLAGNKIQSTAPTAISVEPSVAIVIDGTQAGSGIEVNIGNIGSEANAILLKDASIAKIMGGTYKVHSDDTENATNGIKAINTASFSIKDANVDVFGAKRSNSFYILNNSKAVINNCDVASHSTIHSISLYSKGGTVTASNTDFIAYGDYVSTKSSISKGIYSDGTLTLKNCHVYGTYAGIQQTNGTLTIDGGIYEGYGHGGFYAGKAAIVYARNATIRACPMLEGYKTDSNGGTAGFYIGGASGFDNIKVYMDNCTLHGSAAPAILRGTSGEKNNSLYISNSKINTDAKIRIDNDTLKLYIGVGNNFTAENTNRPTSVIKTDKTYIK